VQSALDQYSKALSDARQNPVDPESAALQAVTTKSAFAILKDALTMLSADGEAVRPGPSGLAAAQIKATTILSNADDRIVAGICSRNDGIRYNVASGAVVDDNVGFTTGDATLVQSGGNWVVDEVRSISDRVGSPDAVCAVWG
jgi:hypothetical protein